MSDLSKTDFDDVIKALLTDDSEAKENFTSTNLMDKICYIKIYRDWVYEEGGWITIEWDLNFIKLCDQADEVKRDVKDFLNLA